MRISARLHQVEQAVKRAERKFMAPDVPHILSPEGWGVFSAQGTRRPKYGATPAIHLLRHFHELKETGEFRLSTHKHYASLGSGLGMDCFTAAEYREPETGLQFSTLTGFEFDQRLCAEARRIGQELGFTNIKFRNEDFIKADLSLFNVIYFYRPFVDNFIPLMAERLRKTTPGTIVISRLFTFPKVFSSEFFRQIYPPESKFSMDTVSLDFFSYVRK